MRLRRPCGGRGGRLHRWNQIRSQAALLISPLSAGARGDEEVVKYHVYGFNYLCDGHTLVRSRLVWVQIMWSHPQSSGYGIRTDFFFSLNFSEPNRQYPTRLLQALTSGVVVHHQSILSAFKITHDCSQKWMGSKRRGGTNEDPPPGQSCTVGRYRVLVIIPRVCWVIRATFRGAVKAGFPLTGYKNADKKAFMWPCGRIWRPALNRFLFFWVLSEE